MLLLPMFCGFFVIAGVVVSSATGCLKGCSEVSNSEFLGAKRSGIKRSGTMSCLGRGWLFSRKGSVGSSSENAGVDDEGAERDGSTGKSASGSLMIGSLMIGSGAVSSSYCSRVGERASSGMR